MQDEVSPVGVLEHFLGRIEEHGPTLRAFRHVDHAGARKQAEQAEVAVLRGDELGLPHGIPVSVQEHVAVAGMPFWSPASGDKQPGSTTSAWPGCGTRGR